MYSGSSLCPKLVEGVSEQEEALASSQTSAGDWKEGLCVIFHVFVVAGREALQTQQ